MTVVPVWRVYYWHSERCIWVHFHAYPTEDEAREHAIALKYRRKVRVRVVEGTRKQLDPKPDPPRTKTRQFLDEEAARMSDLADDKKRYKSPG